MAFYEIVYIVRPDVPTTQVDAITKKLTDIITADKGSVVKNENWGLRSLAYRVKKYKKGYYTMLSTDMNGSLIAELERNMKLSEDIIRFHTVKIDAIDAEPSVMLKYKSRFEGTDSPSATQGA